MTLTSTLRATALGLAAGLLLAPAASASDGKDREKAPEAKRAADATERGAEAPALEEQLRRQEAMLERLEQMLVEQQAEIRRLRGEVDALRGAGAVAAGAGAPAASPAADTAATDATAPATAEAASPAAPDATASAAPPAPTPDRAPAPKAPQWSGEKLSEQVERLAKTFGNLRLSADMRFRYEGFFNQGLDSPADDPARHRLRVRARVGLAGTINEHFDWGIRLATGGFNDPVSTNATLTDFFVRKPFGIDRAYVHFNTATDPVNFDVYAGKFDYTWKRTPLTFDSDLQPEGLSERLRFDLGDDSPLRAVTLTAWQLPFRERGAGADAYIYGGQVLTDWRFSDEWSATLAGAFHDYEQANVIPLFTNVAPTLINAGLEYGTTNAVVVNPATGDPEFLSKFRIVNVLADVTYRGIARRFPLTLLVDYVHNTSAFDDQRDGVFATVSVGQRREQGDLFFEYGIWRVERDAYPSVFMESDVIPTNSINHIVRGSYMLHPKVEFAVNYFFERRLRTESPVNRWLNRYQVDMIYAF